MVLRSIVRYGRKPGRYGRYIDFEQKMFSEKTVGHGGFFIIINKNQPGLLKNKLVWY